MSKKNMERMRAAAVLLREVRLRRYIKRESEVLQNRGVLLVQLSWTDSHKRSYVLDPSEPIAIGRNPADNQISIRHDMVSARHCRLMLHKGRLVVQDLNSANGTYVKKIIRTYKVKDAMYLKNGDKLIIGGLRLKVELFVFDTAFV